MSTRPTASLRRASDLTGKTVMVTGSSRGLGKAMAVGLAQYGAHVVVAARDEKAASQVVETIVTNNGSASYAPFDALDSDSIEQMIETTVKATGKFDGIVINHGISIHESAASLTREQFRTVIETNLVSAFDCARFAGRSFLGRNVSGSIVFISSNGSIVAFEGLAAYGASKGGVDQLSRQLAAEWAPNGIRVNTIAPGYMNSNMRGTETKYGDPAMLAKIHAKIPMGRRGEPDELVGAAAYLLSDAASYVTGQYIAIDGGYHIV